MHKSVHAFRSQATNQRVAWARQAQPQLTALHLFSWTWLVLSARKTLQADRNEQNLATHRLKHRLGRLASLGARTCSCGVVIIAKLRQEWVLEPRFGFLFWVDVLRMALRSTVR